MEEEINCHISLIAETSQCCVFQQNNNSLSPYLMVLSRNYSHFFYKDKNS